MEEQLNSYYFTYGSSDSQPYKGGWTKVYAPSRSAACALFNIYHPPVVEGIINCADIYDESEFRETGMDAEGNRGCGEHETIVVLYIVRKRDRRGTHD